MDSSMNESMEQNQEMDNTMDGEAENADHKDNSGAQDSKQPTVENLLQVFYKRKRFHFERQRVYLTYLYNEFWDGLYRSEACTGDEIKILNPDLPELLTLEVAKIFRTGWEDEHFFPTRLAPPFLDACLFNSEEDYLDCLEKSGEYLVRFVSPEEKELVRRASGVSQELITMLNKYCPGVDFSSCTSVDDACVLAVKTIMCTNLKKTIVIWSPILVGLLEMEEFRFFINQPLAEVSESEDEYDELSKEDKLYLPHKIWKTFFYKWPQSKIDFYFTMLKKGNENLTCFRCGLQNVGPQHLLGNQGCDRIQKTMCKERHNSVLRKIEEELIRSIESFTGQFSRGRDWRYSIAYGGKKGKWPKELALGRVELVPDIVVYSMELGEVVIIDLEIALESMVHPKRIEKRKKYSRIVQNLMRKGFQVFESYVLCGCRGVSLRDLFFLFKGFGLTYKNNSRAMERIGRELISIPYDDYEYCKKRGFLNHTTATPQNDVTMETQ